MMYNRYVSVGLLGDNMKITVLGARGSVPVEGKSVSEFGGATSCVLVETKECAIFLDAGSGIIKAPDTKDKSISILLSHPHLDHLLGLPFFPSLSIKDRIIDFYAKECDGKSVSDIIDGVFAPPYWPCRIKDYPSDFRCHNLTFPMTIGDVLIEAIESNHPGGSLIFKLTNEGKSMVYATDYEYDEAEAYKLISFAQNTDLLFFDSQYTDEEIITKKGFGHSTIARGLKVMKECGAGRVRLVHHDPYHDDEFLKEIEKEFRTDNVSLARRGEEILL